LKELRKKGAADSLIAVFLGNRAVKPFLLPIMISYFGWVYVSPADAVHSIRFAGGWIPGKHPAKD